MNRCPTRLNGSISEHLAAFGIAAIALLVVALVGLLPVALAMADGVRDMRGLLEGLFDGLLWARFGTTLLLAAATLAIAIPVGLLLAWLLVRTDLPGRGWLLVLAPWPLFLPPLVHVLGWYGGVGGPRGWWLEWSWLNALRSGPMAIVAVFAIAYTPLVMLLSVRALDQVGRAHFETMRLIGGRRLVMVDELRQALPSALVGGALALILILADFAVADFLTSVGPKITVYGDTIYAHHLARRSGAAVGAALPGAVIALLLLAWALRRRERLGAAVDARFEPAPRLRLGAWRWLALVGAAAWIAMGTIVPLASLIRQAGAWSTVAAQFDAALPAIRFSIVAAGVSATAIVALAVPLALLIRARRRSLWIELLVALPLAVPPLLYGVGLIRTLNRPGLDAVYLGLGAVAIAMVGRTLVFGLMPVTAAARRIDPALLDAARLAGAGPLRAVTTVALPLLRGPLLVSWCLSFCFALREIDTLIMLRAGQQALTHRLYAHVVFARDDEVAALALILSAVTIAPLLVTLALLRRPARFL